MNTIIEKIRAEIERRKEQAKKHYDNAYSIGRCDAFSEMLNFIYDPEESEKPTIQEQPVMIEWTGNNLKEVIEFTGKSPRFDEWFKTWDEYESYVHSHGNIFKLFNEDGTHLEVPVGAWIFKTPDGRNVPSTFLYKEQPVCEGLEEEAESCWRIVFPDGGIETTKMALTHDEFMMCARHFAKWGAEHAREQMMEDAVEWLDENAWEFAITKSKANYEEFVRYDSRGLLEAFKKAIIKED